MARSTLLLAIVAAIVLMGCRSSPRPSSSPSGPPPTEPPPAGDVRYGVTYCVRDNIALKADVFRPKDRSKPAPAVLFMHAGTWVLGDKLVLDDVANIDVLLAAGFVVASIDYRLAPEFQFPAQLKDAQCAVRYLRENSGDYGIDPERIAAVGASAGGHLAALLGLVPDDAFGGRSGGYEDQRSNVEAVVDLFGPADLETPDFVPNADGIARDVFGAPGAGPSDTLRQASPVTYVSAEAPPFLVVHGRQDSVVPFAQSAELVEKLQAAGAQADLLAVDNAGHGLAPTDGPISPPRDEIVKRIVDFLRRVLTPDASSAPTG